MELGDAAIMIASSYNNESGNVSIDGKQLVHAIFMAKID
jgi:hypothetical protein